MQQDGREQMGLTPLHSVTSLHHDRSDCSHSDSNASALRLHGKRSDTKKITFGHLLFLLHILSSMSRRSIACLALAATLSLTACQNMTTTQRHTATGVAVGAVAGAAVAKATGGKAGKGALIGAAVGGIGTYIWSASMERQRAELVRATRGTGAQVTRTDDNRIKVYMPADITFNSNSAVLKPQARVLLNNFASSLRHNPTAQVLIVGHADSSGGPHINDPLSLSRAEAARSYIFSRKVMGPRIQVDGRGANEPIASNASASGRARNRRIEIFVGKPA